MCCCTYPMGFLGRHSCILGHVSRHRGYDSIYCDALRYCTQGAFTLAICAVSVDIVSERVNLLKKNWFPESEGLNWSTVKNLNIK